MRDRRGCWHRVCEGPCRRIPIPARAAQPITSMNKTISLVFLVVGVVLLIYGLNSSDSVASEVSEAVTGTPTDKSMWLVILGAVGVVAGGVGFFAGRRS